MERIVSKRDDFVVRIYGEDVCNQDDLILDALFDFKPMNRLEYWNYVKMFGSASNGTCKSILNMLKAFNVSDG